MNKREEARWYKAEKARIEAVRKTMTDAAAAKGMHWECACGKRKRDLFDNMCIECTGACYDYATAAYYKGTMTMRSYRMAETRWKKMQAEKKVLQRSPK